MLCSHTLRPGRNIGHLPKTSPKPRSICPPSRDYALHVDDIHIIAASGLSFGVDFGAQCAPSFA